jgi:hypothetical protein
MGRKLVTSFSVVVALVVAGCSNSAGHDSGTPKNPAAWQSGTRLRARIQDGGEGAAYFKGWRDTELGFDCEFGLAEDQKQRCLPHLDSAPTIQYEDPSCERPVVTVSSGQVPPAWLTAFVVAPSSDTSACAVTEGQNRVFQVSGPSSGTDLYSLASTACHKTGSVNAGDTVLSLAAVEPSRFVGASERISDAAGGIAARVLVADDGAIFVDGFRDTKRDQVCDVGSWFGADNRCSSGEAAWLSDYYADPSCTDGLAYTDPCAKPTIVYGTFNDHCMKWGIHELGEPYKGPVYSKSGGSCTAVDTAWWDTHAPYRYGAEISDQFPALKERLIGTGRLRAQRKVAAGAEYELRDYSAFFDTVLDTWCTGTPCMPSGKYGFHPGTADYDATTFADSACTQPIATWQCSGEQAAPTYAIQQDPAGNGSTAYRLGAELAGDIYTLPSGGVCAPATRDPATVYYALGDKVDPATLAPVVERVE